MVASILVAAGLIAQPAQADVVVVLKSLSPAGIHGYARLVPEGKQTRVIIALKNDPPTAVHPAHIHVGQCHRFIELPYAPLHMTEHGRSTSEVPYSLSSLLRAGLIIEIHESSANALHLVSCGVIGSSRHIPYGAPL